MIRFGQTSWRAHRAAVAIAGIASAAALVAGSAALSQDQSAVTPKDTIFARKILMDSINNNMDELETMVGSSGGINLAEGREHAETISVMLLAFPHLFPAPTNQWKPNVERNPGTDTYAAPAIWENFADFYQKAGAASKVAYKAARVKQQDEFRSSVAALRNACDSCHAIYQKNE